MRRAQRQRVGQAVGGRRPALREPRFELVGGAIDADERRLGQERHQVGGRGALDVAGCRTPARSAATRPARRRARPAPRGSRPSRGPRRAPPDANAGDCGASDDDQRSDDLAIYEPTGQFLAGASETSIGCFMQGPVTDTRFQGASANWSACRVRLVVCGSMR